MDMSEAFSIGIVGAGFTGSLLAAHLARQARGPLRIALIERRGEFGPGLAYSTKDAGHLLNVRAGNMSAFPDDPDHFIRWLAKRDGGKAAHGSSGLTFATRRDYGAYVAEVLDEATQNSAYAQVERIYGEAVALTPVPDGVRLQLDGLRYVDVRRAALCTGHLPPLPPPALGLDVLNSSRYVPDPWDEQAFDSIDKDARVIVLGSGLTMVDVVLTLLSKGHRGDILALSRRGLVPSAHELVSPFDSSLAYGGFPATVRELLRALRRDAARAEATGAGWRSAFDALRPYHHKIWRGLSLDEKRRFLRHVRPYWDIHRHRMAPDAARRIAELQVEERLTVRAGRLAAASLTADGLTVTVRSRGGAPAWSVEATALINCSGPSSDYYRARDPIVQAVLEQGLARPDPLNLGLDVTPEGALIGVDGLPSRHLFAFGPLSKAPFYEMTAVPELRGQCADAARRFVAAAEDAQARSRRIAAFG
jgi:uncharacterized NAD(P)/FAD-binding protein YdhS